MRRTVKEIREANNLIAEFMGYKNTTPTDKDFNIYENKEGHKIETMSMRYHDSWEWLMPVIEKIESIKGLTVHIISRHTSILKDGSPNFGHAVVDSIDKKFIRYFGDNKIDGTHAAVSEFAKRYKKSLIKEYANKL